MRERLHRLREEQGQSPWLDNLNRDAVRGGGLERLVEDGVRGVTSNPTIFQRAITTGAAYDEQFRDLAAGEENSEQIFWELAVTDVIGALDVLRPVYDESPADDGFVSLELAPRLARDAAGSVAAGRSLHARIGRPNLFVKLPATAEGLEAGTELVADGISANFTLVFDPAGYGRTIDAYLDGLERRSGDLSGIHSVVAFFISRIDSEVDGRLDAIGSPEALELRGKAAVAQARLAYQVFRDRFSGQRWDVLAARGANPQRLMWASTSTKNPSYPDLLYVDSLIGPDTINTMPDATLEAFVDHGTIERTLDADVEGAADVISRLGDLGIDMSAVGAKLEDEGLAAFSKSFDELVAALDVKSEELRA